MVRQADKIKKFVAAARLGPVSLVNMEEAFALQWTYVARLMMMMNKEGPACATRTSSPLEARQVLPFVVWIFITKKCTCR